MVNKIPYNYECPVDIIILKFIDTHLHIYNKLNITPNFVTTLSLISGTFSAYNIFKGNFKISALLFLIAYYFDCVDGKLARKYNLITKFGDYYDHFSDLFKFILMLYALYSVNKKKFNEIKPIILILIIICMVHLGYQEVIYQIDDSHTLSLFKNIAQIDHDPYETINFTRFFGRGTFVVVMCIIILRWNISKK